jgi:hypothetical protein
MAFLDVGGDYGSKWLNNYGSMPIKTFETPNDLWNWGNVPKGYQLINGTAYPPGTVPQWYYPISFADYTPIVINKTKSSNPMTANSYEADPWLLAQLSGRPVVLINEPHSILT